MVVLALRSFGRRGSAYYRGITWLENRAPSSADERARRILALAPHGDDLQADADALELAQRLLDPGNGGWGLAAPYDGGVLDTALVLRSYAELGLALNVDPALDFLLSQKLPAPDSGWSVTVGGPGAVLVTAEAVLSLSRFAWLDASLGPAAADAATALAAVVSDSDPPLWRARALHALEAVVPGDPAIPVLAASLVFDQAADGSWNGDVQTTAAGLRALSALLGTDAPELASAVFVPDLALRGAINESLGRSRLDAIRVGDMAGLMTLAAAARGIADLTGLEEAHGATFIDLRDNAIVDISPLVGLSTPTVMLGGNPLSPTADTDSDALSDGEEAQLWRTDPLDADSDDDGFDDGVEIAAGSDPLLAWDIPGGGHPVPALLGAAHLACALLIALAGMRRLGHAVLAGAVVAFAASAGAQGSALPVPDARALDVAGGVSRALFAVQRTERALAETTAFRDLGNGVRALEVELELQRLAPRRARPVAVGEQGRPAASAPPGRLERTSLRRRLESALERVDASCADLGSQLDQVRSGRQRSLARAGLRRVRALAQEIRQADRLPMEARSARLRELGDRLGGSRQQTVEPPRAGPARDPGLRSITRHRGSWGAGP